MYDDDKDMQPREPPDWLKPSFDPQPGEVFIAADGGAYGYIVLKEADDRDEVTVREISLKAIRTIDRFKLSYRYMPFTP